MRKTIVTIMLCLSMLTFVCLDVKGEQEEKDLSAYMEVVELVNELFNTNITIVETYDEIRKNPTELYEELCAIAATLNNEQRECMIKGNNAIMNLRESNTKSMRETYFEELTKATGVHSIICINLLAEYYFNEYQNKYLFCGCTDINVIAISTLAGICSFSIDESGYSITDGGRTLYAWATGSILYHSYDFGTLSFNGVTESAEFGYNLITVNDN